jgi:short-subunit dehydrogenase
MDDAQANGMPANECAEAILKAINAGKQEVYIGGREKYGVLIKRLFPRIFAKMIRNAKVT